MKTLYLFRVGVLLLLSLVGQSAWATHIRAGEITARRISGLTYEFTVTTYTDQDGGRAANAQQVDVPICFGDGSGVFRAPRVPTPNTIVDIGNSTARNTYKIIHTFNAPGVYPVSVVIENRNAGTVNLGRSDTDQISWFVETVLLINPTLGQNTTPVLLNPGVDFTAVVGQRFIHNPGAFDAEGDSLSYRLNISKQGVNREDACRGFNIPGYKYPQDVCPGQNEGQTGPATLSIDPRTGDLIWDAPACPGQYNVAFTVEEWRNGVKIGEVTRDMQIIVKDADNKAPRITVPPDLCVEAGTLIQRTVTAIDQPSRTGRRDRLTLTAYSGTFGSQSGSDSLIAPTYAAFSTPAQPQANDPATGTYTWQTNCAHVRQQPYDVLVKVQDNPPPAAQPFLIDSKIFRIRVVAPRPKNLRVAAAAGGKAFVLTWDPYACGGGNLPKGVKIAIYRKEGCDNRTIDPCVTTPPPGYTLVDTVDVNRTTYTDTNGGRGFAVGSLYSYRIQVTYPAPGRGGSAPSDEFCANLPRQVPYITNVTVDKTDKSAGEITVRWTRPLGTSGATGGPFEYRVFRTTGLTGNPGNPIARIPTSLGTTIPDTVYTDRGLNTTDNPYRYKIVVYYTAGGALVPLDSTESASSVRLAAQGAIRSIALSWQFNVPWRNTSYRVFRQVPGQPGTFVQIADNVTATSFTDTGAGSPAVPMTGDQTYCYRVQSVGSYGIPEVQAQLLNFSQVICASPIDTTRPCPPVLALDLLNCEQYVSGPCEQPPFSNKLTWTNPAKNSRGEDCDKNIVRYNIYYKRYQEDEKFTKIDSVTTPQPPAMAYTHGNLTSYAGCYFVTAVNRFGNESQPSNVVCKDNCPAYMLPNVFTPNNDGQNDTFQPMNCPRFVQSVRFIVYNRWGGKVFEHDGDPLITWTGVNNAGQQLPAGTYYYEAEVRFARLSRNDELQTYKGWIQLMR